MKYFFICLFSVFAIAGKNPTTNIPHSGSIAATIDNGVGFRYHINDAFAFDCNVNVNHYESKRYKSYYSYLKDTYNCTMGFSYTYKTAKTISINLLARISWHNYQLKYFRENSRSAYGQYNMYGVHIGPQILFKAPYFENLFIGLSHLSTLSFIDQRIAHVIWRETDIEIIRDPGIWDFTIPSSGISSFMLTLLYYL